MTARRLVSAVSWLSLGGIAVRALSLLTMPLLTRWLSPTGYGEAALVGTVVSLGSVVALAGIDMGYARHHFSGITGPAAQVEAFCWRWPAGMALALAMVGATVWTLLLSRWFNAAAGWYPFVAMGIGASAFATMAQVRARLQNRYRTISLVQIVSGIVAAAFSLGIAYQERTGALALLVAMIVGYALPVALLWIPAPSRLFRRSDMPPAARRTLVAVGLPGLVTAPAYWVVSSSDRWFLARYFDGAEVGVYSIGATVGSLGLVLSMAITSAWLPELARTEASGAGISRERKRELVQLLVAVMLMAWLAVVAAGGDAIRWLADPRFHGAAAVVPWLAAGVLFYGAMHVGNTLLIMLGQLRWSGWIWAFGMVISIVLNLALVPRWGSLGAAWTQCLSFALVMVLVWVAVLRLDPIRLHVAPLALSALLAAGAALLMHVPWSPTPLLSLLLKFPVGVGIALALAALLVPSLRSKIRLRTTS